MKIALIAVRGTPRHEGFAASPASVRHNACADSAAPNLTLLTLAGMTPADHELCYFEQEHVQPQALPLEFDLVALAGAGQWTSNAWRLVDACVARGIPVAMGGLQVTANPAEPLAHGATAIIGEQEVVWPDILCDAGRGALKPAYDARARDFDLAKAPLPAYELLDCRRYGKALVEASRGCPWRCSFCASSHLVTARYKQKPAARVLAEIDRICELWPQPFVVFVDDNAFVNRSYWWALLPELRARRIQWSADTDISVHEDDQLLRMIRDAGCVELAIGFESPSAAGLDGLELRHNFKHNRLHEARLAVARIQAAGIAVRACFLVGLDGHGPWIFDAVRDFVNETKPCGVNVAAPTAFPGTPFYERMKRDGRLLEATHEINFRPQGMSLEQLVDGLHALAGDLHSEQRMLECHEQIAKPPGVRPSSLQFASASAQHASRDAGLRQAGQLVQALKHFRPGAGVSA